MPKRVIVQGLSYRPKLSWEFHIHDLSKLSPELSGTRCIHIAPCQCIVRQHERQREHSP